MFKLSEPSKFFLIVPNAWYCLNFSLEASGLPKELWFIRPNGIGKFVFAEDKWREFNPDQEQDDRLADLEAFHQLDFWRFSQGKAKEELDLKPTWTKARQVDGRLHMSNSRVTLILCNQNWFTFQLEDDKVACTILDQKLAWRDAQFVTDHANAQDYVIGNL